MCTTRVFVCLAEMERLTRPFCFCWGVDWFGILDMYGARESLCLDAMRCLGTVGGDVRMFDGGRDGTAGMGLNGMDGGVGGDGIGEP